MVKLNVIEYDPNSNNYFHNNKKYLNRFINKERFGINLYIYCGKK